MKRIIIQGSSRNNGNTSKIVQVLQTQLNSDVIHLCDYKINQYDYQNRNQGDDFLMLMKEIVTYDLIIFATPVYWYSMSGTMKAFFDRITDCLKIDKETGRKLRGKNMAAISCGSEPLEPEGFFIPFKESAAYLGMNYLGHIHTWIEGKEPLNSVLKNIKEFSGKLT
ncbi:MAG: NAD(P)H-dependent oxidoreductase [Bacteroidota bacterium]